MKSDICSLSGLYYTSWPGIQAVDGGRDGPGLGVTLSDSTNRDQTRVLIVKAAPRCAERRVSQVYTSGGGGHATTLKPGRAWQPYRRRVLLLGRRGGRPMLGGTEPKRRTPNQHRHTHTHTLVQKSIPPGILPTGPQGGARLSHCEATNPRRQRHHRPAGRRAKRGLADHFTGRRCTVTHADGLQEFRSATGHRTRPRSRCVGGVVCCVHTAHQCWPFRVVYFTVAGYLFSQGTLSVPGTPGRVLMTTGWWPPRTREGC